MDRGVLFSLPMESIAVRVIVASVIAVTLARLLLRSGLQVPRNRALTAMIPTAALAAVVSLYWSSLKLPSLMVAVDTVNALPVPVRNTYLHFVPLASSLLVGSWALVASIRVGLRVRRIRATRRDTLAAFEHQTIASGRVRRIVARVADRMGVLPPPAASVPGCPGGATLVGVRSPLLVVDDDLAAAMDEHELEGVIAHELAHLKRRDNLMAAAIGFTRDLAFFVPGGRWALKQLHAEREVAADILAVRYTRRPGALAAGLLKVIETRQPAAGCAAFMPTGTLVDRVQWLVGDRPNPTRMRGGVELTLVATALTAAVAAAVQLPSAVVGAQGERDAVAAVWTPSGELSSDPTEVPEATAFDVYRRTVLAGSGRTPETPYVDDSAAEVRPSTLAACASSGPGCPGPVRHDLGLGLTPRPALQVDPGLVARWRVRTVVDAGSGLGFYVLARVN